MAGDMFLKLDDIDGEAKDDKHGGEIDILSWSWGVTNAGSMDSGGGGGTGKCSVQDISFTKYVDASTAKIGFHCVTGKHIPKGTLVVRKAGGEPMEYLSIEMQKILVTSVSTGGSGGGEKITENCTLQFAEVELNYKVQEDDGSAGAKNGYKYNVETNVATAT